MSESRFSLLEIDGIESAPAPAPASAPAPEVAPAPAVPAIDPIEAFAIRMRAARAEREVAERAARAVREAAEVAAKKAQNNIVAVGAPDETTGAVTYWQLSGDLNLDTFQTAWKAEYLPATWLPAAPSAKVALGRAMKDLQNRNTLVRKHPLGGWTVVNEHTEGDDTNDATLAYTVGPRIYLDGEILTGACTPGQEDATEKLLAIVRPAYDAHRSTVSTVDVSAWLVGLAENLSAVALRERGGVYFVPNTAMAQFRAAKRCLESASSHALYEIPALRSAESVKAIVSAMKREGIDLANAVEAELSAGEIGSRAALGRIKAIDAALEKVRSYERILAVKLGDTEETLLAARKKAAEYTPRGALLEVD